MVGRHILRTNLVIGLTATAATAVASLWPAHTIAMTLFVLLIVTHMVVLLGGTGWTWGAAEPWRQRVEHVNVGWLGAGLLATLVTNGVLTALMPSSSAIYPVTMIGTTPVQAPNTIAASLAVGLAFATFTELWLRTARRRRNEEDVGTDS